MNKTLKVGLPKGSLQETTLKLLKKAGWNFNLSSRAYKPYFFRLQQISPAITLQATPAITLQAPPAPVKMNAKTIQT